MTQHNRELKPSQNLRQANGAYTNRYALFLINAAMKKNILFISISILIGACNTQNQDFEKHTWVSAADSPGLSYLGVLDLEKKPYSSYIVSYQDDRSPVHIRDDSIYFDSTYFGKIFYQHNQMIALASPNGDTIFYHSIPDLENADSLDYVFNFLVSNPILYADETVILKMQYDSATNESGWNRSFFIDSLRQFDFDNFSNWQHLFNYGFHTKWHLTTLNNSIVLLNSPTNWLEGYSFDILLIEKITPSKLTAKKIEIPRIGREALQDSIRASTQIDFKYETCTFEKRRIPSPELIKVYKEILCSKTWVSTTPDSLISYGKGIIPKHDSITTHPQTLTDFSFSFRPDNTYLFKVGEASYSGLYEFSRDGEYLILDKSGLNESCVKFNSMSGETLKIQQLINKQTEGRRYIQYNCYLTLK